MMMLMLSNIKNEHSLIKILGSRTLDFGTSLENAELSTEVVQYYPNVECVNTPNGTHYHLYRASPNKPNIILLHAMGGNLHNWLPIVDKLRGQFNLYVPDLPWHGRTVANELIGNDYIGYYVSWLNKFISSAGLTNASIIGHSLGARIAAATCLTLSLDVKAVVLLTPALSPSFKGLVRLEEEILAILARQHTKVVSRELFKLFLHEMLVKKNPTTINYLDYAIEELVREQGSTGMQGILHALKWFKLYDFDYTDLEAVAGAIPVSILCGQRDIYCPNLKLWEVRNSKIELRVIKNSGHLLPLEHPQLCSNVISKYAYR
jgi:pimeloyl-ACP methyl ester carboxylesterase